MCGILITSGLKRAFHHRQLAGLKKRGPDEIGYWIDDRIQIGHTRLSIIGLDDRSTEPLENDTHVLAFNGEIYNFIELREKLAGQGIPLPGANDAAALLHAWGRSGPEILKELDGFWAFAIYDKRSRVVTLARDQYGVKPLYYHQNGNQLCVSSLIRTIVEVLGASPELDYASLSEYVRYQFTFGDKTFLRGIRKVRPGHFVEINLETGESKSRCYEDIFEPPDESLAPLTGDWIEETRELLKRCVVESTISDTSFTTFCSGGIDSSLITRIAAPEIAYHCNYSDPDCNETIYAKQVVEGTPTRLFVVNAQESFDLVEKLGDIVQDFDEPSIGSVILPLDDLLAQVKRRYKVILTGTGGDELFAGYVRYQLALGECYQDSYRPLFDRMKRLPRVSDRFEMFHHKGDISLYSFYQPETAQTFRDAFAICRNGSGDLGAMLRFDRRHFLAGLLNIDDKMSGRHSLESRPSFLHQKFVRHIVKLEPNAFLSNGDIKPILRSIAAGILPKSITHRADKMGFTTPIGTFVNQNAHRIREQLQNSRFRHLYNLSKMSLSAETKYSREVFGLLILDLWLNRYAASAARDHHQVLAAVV
ncbi:MAG: asparagine synthase (glutamine-hydrolyzing) [Candidatus Acidiferrales bacterium]